MLSLLKINAVDSERTFIFYAPQLPQLPPTQLPEHTTLHPTAGLLLKLSKVGLGWSLDGRPDAAGNGVGWPVGGILSFWSKKIYPNAPGQTLSCVL